MGFKKHSPGKCCCDVTGVVWVMRFDRGVVHLCDTSEVLWTFPANFNSQFATPRFACSSVGDLWMSEQGLPNTAYYNASADQQTLYRNPPTGSLSDVIDSHQLPTTQDLRIMGNGVINDSLLVHYVEYDNAGGGGFVRSNATIRYVLCKDGVISSPTDVATVDTLGLFSELRVILLADNTSIASYTHRPGGGGPLTDEIRYDGNVILSAAAPGPGRVAVLGAESWGYQNARVFHRYDLDTEYLGGFWPRTVVGPIPSGIFGLGNSHWVGDGYTTGDLYNADAALVRLAPSNPQDNNKTELIGYTLEDALLEPGGTITIVEQNFATGQQEGTFEVVLPAAYPLLATESTANVDVKAVDSYHKNFP